MFVLCVICFDFKNSDFNRFQFFFKIRARNIPASLEPSIRDATQMRLSYCKVFARSLDMTYVRLAYSRKGIHKIPIRLRRNKNNDFNMFPFLSFSLSFSFSSSIESVWKSNVWFFHRFLARTNETNTLRCTALSSHVQFRLIR